MDRMGTMAVSVMYECMRGGRWTGWEDGQGGNDGCECHI